MRVAALYDIHGNLPALKAVVREVHRAEVDRVVVGGDVVPGVRRSCGSSTCRSYRSGATLISTRSLHIVSASCFSRS